MNRKSIKKGLRNYLVITLAAIVYAAGVSLFLDPNNLAPGGVTGIAILLNRLIGVNTGTLIMILNVPIILLGMWKFGWKFIVSTFYAIFAVSAATDILAPVGALTKEPMLAAIAGGALSAAALGIIFRAGATTGGTDIIIKVLRLKYPHMRTGFLFLLSDVMIAGSSLFVFGDVDVVLYALLAVFVMSRVMDIVLYGTDEAKLIYIISDKPKEIADRILEEIEIGVTYLDGRGGYSSQSKEVIMCVTRKQQAPKIEEIVKEEDPRAFMIVTSASEIYGEGYKNIFADKI
ncbi:YitT family protein [Lachnospiraceae bacterium JLR.KK008]